jgi:hypothetical protein
MPVPVPPVSETASGDTPFVPLPVPPTSRIRPEQRRRLRRLVVGLVLLGAILVKLLVMPDDGFGRVPGDLVRLVVAAGTVLFIVRTVVIEYRHAKARAYHQAILGGWEASMGSASAVRPQGSVEPPIRDTRR